MRFAEYFDSRRKKGGIAIVATLAVIAVYLGMLTDNGLQVRSDLT
jgi:hypothetical protein